MTSIVSRLDITPLDITPIVCDLDDVRPALEQLWQQQFWLRGFLLLSGIHVDVAVSISSVNWQCVVACAVRTPQCTRPRVTDGGQEALLPPLLHQDLS